MTEGSEGGRRRQDRQSGEGAINPGDGGRLKRSALNKCTLLTVLRPHMLTRVDGGEDGENKEQEIIMWTFFTCKSKINVRVYGLK